MFEGVFVMKRIVGCGLLVLALGGSAAMLAAPLDGQSGSSGRSSQGYLGIDVRNVSDDQISALKLKDAKGAVIVRVDHDGPAGKMGLREHDVVVQMNGSSIEGEEQMRRLLRETAPGRTVALVIVRDGQQLALSTQMADRNEVERQAWELHLNVPPPGGGPQAPLTGLPSEDPAQYPSQAPANGPIPTTKYSRTFLGTILLTPAYTGIMLEPIGPQLAQFFGVPKGAALLVKGVDSNSPAAVAGIKAGDVMLRADSRPIATMTDWTKVVREAKGRPVTVVLLRDRQERTVTVTPDAKKHS